MLTFNVIGAGQVGQTLAHLWVHGQHMRLVGIVNAHLDSALQAVQFVGEGCAYADISQLPHADVTLITTPDDIIDQVAALLDAHSQMRAGDVVMHCSGVLSSDCLSRLRLRQLAVASVHPMMSFKHLALNIRHFLGTPCAMEGDEYAVRLLTPLFQAIGADVYAISARSKALYHAAGIFASNYLVTLAQQAWTCLTQAELEPQQAQHVLNVLLQSTYQNIQHAEQPIDALTGPLQRGDATTVAKHLQVLPEEMQTLYRVMAKATLTHLDAKVQEKLSILID